MEGSIFSVNPSDFSYLSIQFQGWVNSVGMEFLSSISPCTQTLHYSVLHAHQPITNFSIASKFLNLCQDLRNAQFLCSLNHYDAV